MANIYSNMTQKEKDNERAYLTNLQNSGNSGEKEWATSQLKQLNSVSSPTSSNAQKEIDMINAAIKSNNSDSGSSSYTPNYGSVNTEKVDYNPYEEAYKEAMDRYNKLNDQIAEQNRLAVEQGTNRLNAQKDTINKAAEDNARQAYIMQMQAKKALPQQLAGQGATGGTTETANLGIQTAYQNTLNDINRNKVNSIQEIDNAIADLKTTGNLATVEQVLANNQASLDAYMDMLNKGVSYNQWANQYNANRADTAYEQGYQERAYQDALKQYEDALKQQAFENELARQNYNLKTLESAEKSAEKQAEKVKDNYNSVYKEAKNLWEAGDVTAEEINNWLALQDLTDAEHEQIITSLGVKAILDNLDRLGKLSY